MAYISGKWKWNKTFLIDELPHVNYEIAGSIRFKSNNQVFNRLSVFSSATNVNPVGINYDNQEVRSLHVHEDGAGYWYTTADFNEAYRVMDFGATEQWIDEEIYEFIVANARSYGEVIADMLETIAENERKVFDAGKQAEYDAFWDAYMPEKLSNSQYLFYSPRWSDKNFYPNKDIKPTGAAPFSFSSHQISNFKQRLIDCGVTLDTSGVTSGNYMFCFCSVLTHLPSISLLGLTDQVSNMFADNKVMIEVEKIILKDDGSTTFVNWFNNCNALTTIAFEGVIGQNINFQWSTKLTRASMESIVNHLAGTDTDISGKTLTLSRAAVDEAFRGISAGDFTTIVPGSSSLDWFNLEMSKPNWTITLV